MSVSHIEVGCPGTWGLELLIPNPGSKSTQACPTRNPATSPACHSKGRQADLDWRWRLVAKEPLPPRGQT